ncbi:MAG: EcsC family protein [Verrucomicrobia subdivision 3 bacterium]|nr:EcsC family protein [Limisphaerales bacterium]
MSFPPPLPTPKLLPQELHDLRYAKMLLENPGFTARIANLIGTPIEKGFKMLPKNWSDVVHKASKGALMKALQLAVMTLGPRNRAKSSERFHKLLVGASGGIGGVFGLAALPIELPVSTTIMLRSIADIARSEGHSLSTVQTRLSCLEVFALGGRSAADDAVESSYWAVRAALARAISDAAAYLAHKGVLERSAPAIVRLIAAISSRFGVVVSEQLAAKAVPIVGAAGGTIVNVLFMDHFQDMARGHFIVKRLEAKYGMDVVQTVYNSIAIRIS